MLNNPFTLAGCGSDYTATGIHTSMSTTDLPTCFARCAAWDSVVMVPYNGNYLCRCASGASPSNPNNCGQGSYYVYNQPTSNIQAPPAYNHTYNLVGCANDFTGLSSREATVLQKGLTDQQSCIALCNSADFDSAIITPAASGQGVYCGCGTNTTIVSAIACSASTVSVYGNVSAVTAAPSFTLQACGTYFTAKNTSVIASGLLSNASCLSACAGWDSVIELPSWNGNGSVSCTCASGAAAQNPAPCSSTSYYILSNSTQPIATSPINAAAVPLAGWTDTGMCMTEVSGRALPAALYRNGTNTPAMCTAFCASQGYSIAGVENGNECWCDSQLRNGAMLNSTSTACTKSCSGSSKIRCGGPNALHIYVNATATQTLNANLQYQYAPASLPAGWQIAQTACIAEPSIGRALAGAMFRNVTGMTVPMCLSFCGQMGYQFAGLEFGQECWCSDALENGASLSSSSSACTTQCAGDSTTVCGGVSALNLYQNPTLSWSTSRPIVGGYQWQGCLVDSANRLLDKAYLSTPDMTVPKCTSFCASKNLPYAGLENGGQCYCGDSITPTSQQCYTPCAGDKTTNCGGPWALAVYHSSPVNTKRRSSDDAPGSNV